MTQVESERAKQHQAEILSSLLKIEAFQTLEEALKREEKRMAAALWQLLVSSDGVEAPQRLLDHHRGFVQGMRYALAVPRGAQRSLRGEVEEEVSEMADGWATWAG